jgi:hypothetical protein
MMKKMVKNPLSHWVLDNYLSQYDKKSGSLWRRGQLDNSSMQSGRLHASIQLLHWDNVYLVRTIEYMISFVKPEPHGER